jgi:hypothetical protein
VGDDRGRQHPRDHPPYQKPGNDELVQDVKRAERLTN